MARETLLQRLRTYRDNLLENRQFYTNLNNVTFMGHLQLEVLLVHTTPQSEI